MHLVTASHRFCQYTLPECMITVHWSLKFEVKLLIVLTISQNSHVYRKSGIKSVRWQTHLIQKKVSGRMPCTSLQNQRQVVTGSRVVKSPSGVTHLWNIFQPATVTSGTIPGLRRISSGTVQNCLHEQSLCARRPTPICTWYWTWSFLEWPHADKRAEVSIHNNDIIFGLFQ